MFHTHKLKIPVLDQHNQKKSCFKSHGETGEEGEEPKAKKKIKQTNQEEERGKKDQEN